MILGLSDTCYFQVEWEAFLFRDCNGVSNGLELPIEVIKLEQSLVGTPASGFSDSATFSAPEITQQTEEGPFSIGKVYPLDMIFSNYVHFRGRK